MSPASTSIGIEHFSLVARFLNCDPKQYRLARGACHRAACQVRASKVTGQLLELLKTKCDTISFLKFALAIFSSHLYLGSAFDIHATIQLDLFAVLNCK